MTSNETSRVVRGFRPWPGSNFGPGSVFWKNKMEIREWKIRQWNRNNQREILYTNMKSKLKSRVGWVFRPRWGSNFGPERCFLRKNIEICKWKLCWWVRNDQDKIPYKNIQLVKKSDMKKVFCWSKRWRMSLENAFFQWIMRKKWIINEGICIEVESPRLTSRNGSETFAAVAQLDERPKAVSESRVRSQPLRWAPTSFPLCLLTPPVWLMTKPI